MSADYICSLCNKSIYGEYYHYSDSSNICEKCYNHYPKCLVCKITMKKWYNTKIGKLCTECYDKEDKCYICRVPFFKGLRYKNKLFCIDCYNDLPNVYAAAIK